MAKIERSRPSTLQLMEGRTYVQKRRTYMGMSQLGHHCERYLWMQFNWCSPPREITARLHRLFNRGHNEEPIFEDELKHLGVRVYDDQAQVSSCFGHIKGHCDGKGVGYIEAQKTEHLNEYKTMNDKSFKDTCKNGVKLSKFVYYIQMQCYMLKLKIDRGMFFARNKNDDATYVERIKLDKVIAEKFLQRGERLVLAQQAPDRKPNFTPSWFQCRWCDENKRCFGYEPLDKNCRTCSKSEPDNKGEWICGLDEHTLTYDEQCTGCDDYTQITFNV